jgi:hypothetical protein
MKVETKNVYIYIYIYIYNGSTEEGKTMINEWAKTVGRAGKKEEAKE